MRKQEPAEYKLPPQSYERMESLLKAPESGRDAIWTLKSGEKVKANCCGTLLYVLMFPKHIDQRGLVVLPGDRPGFVHPQVADAFISKYFEPVQDARAGAIVGFDGETGKFNHAGLMLDRHRFFNQWGHGGIFKISDIRGVEGVPVFYKVEFNKQF